MKPCQFSEDYHRNRLKFLQAIDKVTKKLADIPEFKGKFKNGSHGSQVMSLLGGATYGTAQDCTVYAVSRPPMAGNPELNDWEKALNAVAKDFSDKRKTKPELHGVMNISAGFQNTKERKKALENVLAAGIIVVGAAGNESVRSGPV